MVNDHWLNTWMSTKIIETIFFFREGLDSPRGLVTTNFGAIKIVLVIRNKSSCWSYYLRNEKIPLHLHVYLRLESTNHQKIGDIIEAL